MVTLTQSEWEAAVKFLGWDEEKAEALGFEVEAVPLDLACSVSHEYPNPQ